VQQLRLLFAGGSQAWIYLDELTEMTKNQKMMTKMTMWPSRNTGPSASFDAFARLVNLRHG
jgi:hypothetical protein